MAVVQWNLDSFFLWIHGLFAVSGIRKLSRPMSLACLVCDVQAKSNCYRKRMRNHTKNPNLNHVDAATAKVKATTTSLLHQG